MNREIIGMYAQNAVEHLEKGELREARDDFRQAYEFAKICGRAGDLVCTMRDLGNMELRLGNEDEAEKLLLNAMVIKGAEPVTYLSVRDSIANMLARNGDYSSALSMLRGIRNELGHIYSEDETPFHIKIFEQHLESAIGHLETIAAGASYDSEY